MSQGLTDFLNAVKDWVSLCWVTLGNFEFFNFGITLRTIVLAYIGFEAVVTILGAIFGHADEKSSGG